MTKPTVPESSPRKRVSPRTRVCLHLSTSVVQFYRGCIELLRAILKHVYFTLQLEAHLVHCFECEARSLTPFRADLKAELDLSSVTPKRDDLPYAKRSRKLTTQTRPETTASPRRQPAKWDDTYVQKQPLTTCIRNNVSE